jgi:hypothetical protein
MTKRPSLADSMRQKMEAPTPIRPAPVVIETAGATAKPAAPKVYHAATRAGLKKVTAGLSLEDHKRFRLLSVNLGKTNEELLREAIEDLFQKHA